MPEELNGSNALAYQGNVVMFSADADFTDELLYSTEVTSFIKKGS